MDSTSSRTITLPLSCFGRPPSRAEVLIRGLSLGERLRRAGLVLGAGIGVAVIALPIPIVHLVLPPVALALGIIGGARRLSRREVFQLAEAECPYCGTRQRLNLAGASFRLPQDVTCIQCLQLLSLGEGVAPPHPPG